MDEDSRIMKIEIVDHVEDLQFIIDEASKKMQNTVEASSAALAPRPPVPRPVDFITAVLLQAARLIAR